MLGFFHTLRAGRPALALDLMEPFRPACLLRPRDLATLEAKLRDIIHHEEDQVAFFDLGPAPEAAEAEDEGPPRSHTLGRPMQGGGEEALVV